MPVVSPTLRPVIVFRFAVAALAGVLLLLGPPGATARELENRGGTAMRTREVLALGTALILGGIAGAALRSRRRGKSHGPDDTRLGSMQHEIGERHAAEAELRKNQERMRAILDTTVDAIITADRHGTILSCNRAAEQMFGYRAEELLNRNVGMLMPDPHRELHDTYMERYLRTGQSRIIGVGREVIALHKNGNRMPVDLALSDAMVDGEHLFTAVMRDIRDRKRLEAGLSAASEQVRREIGQELHDALGQQLTGISLLAKTLDRQLAAHDDALQQNAAAIVDLARQAMEQVRTLAHGLYPVNLRRLGLGGALQELAETLAHRLGIQCPVEVDPVAATLPETAALHFYRIAQEAANNAIRHAKATRVSVRLGLVNDNIELRVEDNGPGLPAPPAEIKGMGFSIMAYRAGLLGGTIEFETSAEGGLAVVFRRPMDDPDR